ncbi:MAG: hypothetical protein ACXU8O_08935, partial [Asticcacaulis sp.]
MTPISLRLAALATVSTLSLASGSALACASCGCTITSDWENLNFASHGGLKLDLRYDTLDQTDLRSGGHRISPQSAALIVNDGDPQEVEKYTDNRYTTLGIDYSRGGDWGVNVQVPYIDRRHETLGTASDGITPGPDGGSYVSRTSNLGDIRVVGRFSGFTPQHNAGLLFGLKLPTGRRNLSGASTDPTATGPVEIDPGLQPGSGTTDLILGAYYADNLDQNWNYYAQVLYQRAFRAVDGYRPGDGYNLNLGLRYAGFGPLTPQLQLNVRDVRHDTGARADTVSTGGTLAYLTPGLAFQVNNRISLYGFVQTPIYQ